MRYRLIAIDLDGTLLNSSKGISEENARAIRYAMGKGVKVVVCSGRIFAGARIFARQLEIQEPVIACNGAIIRNLWNEEVLFKDCMNTGDSLQVADICHSEGIYFHVYIGDTMYTEQLAFSSLFYWKKNKSLGRADQVDIQLVEDIKPVLHGNPGNVAKIVVASEDLQQLARARERASGIPGVGVTSSEFKNFEVVNRGVSKGKALDFLARQLGVAREEIMAMGDNENDATMFEAAGFKVAMGNGEKFIKEAADYITLGNNEDGVAHAIRRFIL